MEHQQNQPPQGGVPGPTGRRLHIAHRRSPSELTPLMSMFSSPGSKLFSFGAAIMARCRHRSSSSTRIETHLTYVRNSGTTCDSTTNRAIAATAAANSSYTPAICQYGHDSTNPTPRPRRMIPSSAAADAEPLPPKCFSVSKPNAATAAADECTHGCSYTTLITSP